MNEARVESRSKPRFSAIWILPAVAVILGAWLVVDNYLSQGPRVEVTFKTAEGITAGETLVKRLSVELGVVDQVYLNDNYSDVTVVLQLDDGAQELLGDDTQFWVVRPRVGTSGITGLSTLLSGAYIELAPGSGNAGKERYTGLEEAPITPITTPGLRVQLISDKSSLLTVGSPVMYNGFKVGRVEESFLSIENGERYYRLFIDAPYHDLVNSNTRFWNAGGIDFDAGAEGVSVKVASLEALLSGGVSFGLTDGQNPGERIETDHIFTLYAGINAIEEQPYEFSREYLLMFNGSVRGLVAGAPVEYRGVRLGTVTDVSLDLIERERRLTADGRTLMPVLIQIDPARLLSEDSASALTDLDDTMAEGVANGLRASLANGNLLTGSLYVTLDFYDDVPPAEITEESGLPLLPSINTGLDQLTQQVTRLMAKFQELPLEQTFENASQALEQLKTTVSTADHTLAGVNQVLNDPATGKIPLRVEEVLRELTSVLAGISPDSPIYSELEITLNDLQETIRNARELISTLEARPNSLIFSSPIKADPIPGTPSQ